MRTVDLGVCEGKFFDGDPDRVAIVLPGAGYGQDAPLLWFAREALQAQGWSILQVWDRWDGIVDGYQWASERLEASLSETRTAEKRLLVAKSLSSLALPDAVERDLSGIWLTPLLNRDEVRSAMTESISPTLAVGGTGDPTWDSEFIASLPNIEVIEIDGADHALQHHGDTSKSLDSLRIVTDGITAFASRLG